MKAMLFLCIICGYKDDLPANLQIYLLCRGGDSKGFPPPNEVRPIVVDGNGVRNGIELTVGVGSKSRNQVRLISILVAFVMGSYRSDATKPIIDRPNGKFQDIGLLMSRDKSGNGVDFYSHSTTSGNFAVGSLCLAAEKIMDTKDYYAGKVVTAGWGDLYSDKKSNGKPMQFQHSCTTNQFGPVEARFQHCNVDMLTMHAKKDWGCNKVDKPSGYEADKCIDYLREAQRAVEKEIMKLDDQNIVQELWSLTNKIEIVKSFPKRNSICYKSEVFDEYGWCYLANWRSWGFCDSSCELINEPDPRPIVYHKMIWEYPGKRGSRCSHDAKYYNEDWYLCIVSMLPQTSVFRFKKNSDGSLRLLTAIKETPEDIGKSKDIGHQLPCKGDSGSAHWMYNSKEEKRAVIAVTSFSNQEVCGMDEHLMKTTHPSVLSWIKKYSEIKP